MPTDQVYRKSGSPQASTEVSSLQLNRTKNKEALEKSLKCRRSVKELVNQGILLNPSISHPDKVRQLQKAKTSDLLKRKIGQRPDRQYLISHHILRDDKPRTSPFILEQCHNLEKSQLKETLAAKLISRPGSLELVEKGVLQVDPGVDSLIKQGSIQYPRVESVSLERISCERLQPIQELVTIPPPPPLSSTTKTHYTNSGRVVSGRSRLINSNKTSTSRAIRDDTVVSKLGSLVFHQYCPDSSSSSSPSLANVSSFQQKQRVRELQQVEMLRLQDTARVHRLVEQELCERVSTCRKPLHEDTSFMDITPNSFSNQTNSQLALSCTSSSMSLQVPPTPSNSIVCSKNQIGLSNQRTGSSKALSLESNFNLPSLAHLTLTQLKGECKDRNLPRAGSKMQLMRLLNPYRREILAKYFPNSVMKQSEEIESGIDGSRQFHNDQHQKRLVNSEQPMMDMDVNLKDFDSSLLSQTKPMNLCTTVFSSGSTMPKDLQVYSDVVMRPDSSNVLFAQPCVSLRHSVSAPFFPEISSNSSSGHTTHFQIPSTQGNISSTTLIPVTFVNDNTMNESDQISQIPVSSFELQFVQTTSKQSFVCVTPNVLPDNQTSSNADFDRQNGNLINHHPLTSIPSSESGYIITSNQHLPLSLSIDNSVSSPYNESQTMHHTSVNNSLDNQSFSVYSPVASSNPTGGEGGGGGCTGFSTPSTTLHQIEEMWLRIRQLRRNIEQTKNSQYSSNDPETLSVPANLEYLQQEHNRLAVLCRLLIIERLDTLDEISANGTRFFESNDSSSSDFKIERNLLNSYLRRLGGSILTNSLSSPNTESILSTDSSSFLFEQLSCGHTTNYTTCNTLRTPGISFFSDSYPMTPESRFDDHGNDDEQICSDLQNSPVSGHLKSCAYDNPLEQLPSPMTTDILFELWNSVVEDTSGQSMLTTNTVTTTGSTIVDSSNAKMNSNNHHGMIITNPNALSNFYSVQSIIYCPVFAYLAFLHRSSSSNLQSNNFLQYPTLNSQTFITSSNSLTPTTISTNMFINHGNESSPQFHPLLWSNLSHATDRIFPIKKNSSSNVFNTTADLNNTNDKRVRFLHCTDKSSSHLCSMINFGSTSQNHIRPPTTELLTNILLTSSSSSSSSFNNNSSLSVGELMDTTTTTNTTDFSSILSFPVSLNLNWSIGT
ncbi:myocardin-related transcription factor [Schistosoma mansoni]|uniref:myocardin-related transcription factor n=1 Tax=Schistosoma mansoni TaxID=6183 RepID=UPI0001A63801|nr:myocardin-related transcription factor [Schistosoma mansoni]|eukprot:XP_018654783.1 myocardin-related transcription factor [Schistosoma mansoni]